MARSLLSGDQGISQTPASEASSSDAFNEDISLDLLLRQSPMRDALGIEDEEDAETVEDSSEETSEDAEAEEVAEKVAEEDTEEDTEDSEVEAEATEDDIDWDYKIPLEIDGKVTQVPLKDIREQAKALSAARAEIAAEKAKLAEGADNFSKQQQEILVLGQQLHNELSAVETKYAAEYHKLKKQYDEARTAGDTFTARDLREHVEEAKENYWNARKTREGRLAGVAKQLQEAEQANKQALLEKFQKDIQQIPDLKDFTPALAQSIRAFAIEEGLSEELVDSIYHAPVIKMLNDYRKLKNGLKAGSVKLEKQEGIKKAPLKQGISQTPSKAAEVQRQALRKKALSGEANADEQMAFLKGLVRQKF